MIKVEEKLDNINSYAIFVNNEEVFNIDKKDVVDKIFEECINIPLLLQKFYEYGLQNKKIIFGIKNVEEIREDI